MRIPVHNNTAMTIYVAGLMIPPGETRHFEEEQVPLHLRPAPVEQESEPAAPADPLAELLQGSIAKITPELAAMSTENLEQLGELEQQGQARKGLLGAIAEELLKRASAADLKTQLEAIPGLSDDDLKAQLEAEAAKGDKANADLVAALKAESDKRAGNKE